MCRKHMLFVKAVRRDIPRRGRLFMVGRSDDSGFEAFENHPNCPFRTAILSEGCN